MTCTSHFQLSQRVVYDPETDFLTIRIPGFGAGLYALDFVAKDRNGVEKQVSSVGVEVKLGSVVIPAIGETPVNLNCGKRRINLS